MPLVEFKPENRLEDATSYPRLKLDMGAQARILCIEKTPHFEWVHRLTRPRIVNGIPEYKTAKNRDGVDTTMLENDFISMPFCLGDEGTIQDTGIDPANCPICAESRESSIVRAPDRRFAMHVFRYGIKPNGSWEVTEPFSGQIVAWVYGEKLFDKLIGLAETWGGLQNNDLLLGPLTKAPAVFQQFDVAVAPDAAYRLSKERGEYVVATYKEGRAKDLAPLVGRSVPRNLLDQDLESIRAAWQVVKRHEQGSSFQGEATFTPTPDLTAGLAALTNEDMREDPVPDSDKSFGDLVASTPAVEDKPDDDLEGLLDPPAVTPNPEIESDETTLSFDDLLGSLPD